MTFLIDGAEAEAPSDVGFFSAFVLAMRIQFIGISQGDFLSR